MIEEFRSKISSQGYIRVGVGMDPLQTVLVKIIDNMKKLEEKVNINTELISSKISRDDMDVITARMESEIKKNAELSEQTVNELQQQLKGINGTLVKMREKAEENNNDANDKVNKMNKELNEQIQTHHVIYTSAISKLNAGLNEVRGHLGNLNDEMHVVKDTLQMTGLSSINLISEKIDNHEERLGEIAKSMKQMSSSIENVHSGLNEQIMSVKQLHGHYIDQINREVADIKNQYIVDPKFNIAGNIDNANGADLTQLILAVRRDTRRLDAMDQKISAVKIECENIATEMENAQRILQKFNHNIYDFQRQLDGTRGEISSRFQLLENFFKWIGSNIKDIWIYIQQVSSNTSHIASSVSRAQDDIYNIINSMSHRPLPAIHQLDEAVVESCNIQDQIHEKRMNIESDKQFSIIRPIFNSKWKTPISNNEYQEIPPFKRSMEAKYTILPELSDKLKTKLFSSAQKDDSIIINSLEELRVKVDICEEKIRSFIEETTETIKSLSTKVDSKVSIADNDRLFFQIQKSMKNLKAQNLITRSSKQSSQKSINSNPNDIGDNVTYASPCTCVTDKKDDERPKTCCKPPIISVPITIQSGKNFSNKHQNRTLKLVSDILGTRGK